MFLERMCEPSGDQTLDLLDVRQQSYPRIHNATLKEMLVK